MPTVFLVTLFKQTMYKNDGNQCNQCPHIQKKHASALDHALICLKWCLKKGILSVTTKDVCVITMHPVDIYQQGY